MSDGSDLVLDACPSPPRIDDSNNINEANENGKENTQNEKNFSEEFPKKPKSKTKKSKKHGPVNLMKITNCVGVQFGPTIIMNSGSTDTNPRKKESVVMTKDIQKLFECNNQLNRQDLLFISSHMGKGWEDIARALDYSEGQIFQFNTNYINSGIKEVIYQFLLDWTRTKPNEATISRIVKLLWDFHQKQVVKLMADR